MLTKLIAFIKSRPTEVWLGLWAAVVAVLVGLDLKLPDGLDVAMSAVVGWIVTFITTKKAASPKGSNGS